MPGRRRPSLRSGTYGGPPSPAIERRHAYRLTRREGSETASHILGQVAIAPGPAQYPWAGAACRQPLTSDSEEKDIAMIRPPGFLVGTCMLVAMTAPPLPPAPARTARPSLFSIPLEAQGMVPGAKGVAAMRPARSPFGFALTIDGNFIFDTEVTVTGLPAPSALGPFATYAVWATNSDLTEVRFLGPLRDDQPTRGKVSFSKFLIFVTAERAAPGPRWKGPVLLRGFSPSNFLENFGSKTLLNGGAIPPQ